MGAADMCMYLECKGDEKEIPATDILSFYLRR